MNWRTDKPTADLIVAQVGYAEEFYYEILTRLPNGEYRGEYDTQPLHHILKWADLKEDETVTDCHQLEDEIDSEWAKCKPVDEGMGLESAIIVNEQFDDIARHFAKWGAEHLKTK